MKSNSNVVSIRIRVNLLSFSFSNHENSINPLTKKFMKKHFSPKIYLFIHFSIEISQKHTFFIKFDSSTKSN